MEITIKSNGHARDLLNWGDLSEKERAEFDYLETDDEQWSAEFFRYRGSLYCTDMFTRVHDQFVEPWEGYHADTYFSGVLIYYTDDHDGVFVGRYYC